MLSCFVNISICCFPEVDSNTMKALFTHLFYYHVTRDSERGIGIAIPSVGRPFVTLSVAFTYIHKSFIKMMTKRIKLPIKYTIKSI